MKMAPNAVCVNQENEPVSRTYQYRKIMKPMLERKRRARINRCLDELKDLMTGAYQCNEGENVAKLEKADILELTVKHLHTLRQQNKLHVRPDINLTERFRAGFSHCATEVTKFLNNVDQNAGLRVVQHLNDCVRRLDTTTVTYPMNPPNAVAPIRPTTVITSKFTNYYQQTEQQHPDQEFFRQQQHQHHLQQQQHQHQNFVNAHPQQAYIIRYEDLKVKQQMETNAEQSVWRPWG